MSTAHTWLVTGSSRGIGLELVRQLLEDPSNVVIAACRNPDGATALQALRESDTAKGELHVVGLDVSDETSIRGSVKAVEQILGEGRGLDYLVNNAAVHNGDDSAFAISSEAFTRIFQTNVVGPALMGEVYLPYLLKSTRKVIVNTSSGLGSISLCQYGPRSTTYAVTKAALNMLTNKQAKARPELIVISLCPGWVKTDMGGKAAELEPHDSISGILKVVTSLGPKDSGKFYRYNGEEWPW
ncbi:NAD-P-binding protein [Obba rivulosa]|uniref:NAD-P-binding protein n=1 Tax=Obba rivulosa TaxID=1052685 RepID=A0A8E2J5W1_9APHY|nr:NAD-P-binding protein [Obba rivulosa]